MGECGGGWGAERKGGNSLEANGFLRGAQVFMSCIWSWLVYWRSKQWNPAENMAILNRLAVIYREVVRGTVYCLCISVYNEAWRTTTLEAILTNMSIFPASRAQAQGLVITRVWSCDSSFRLFICLHPIWLRKLQPSGAGNRWSRVLRHIKKPGREIRPSAPRLQALQTCSLSLRKLLSALFPGQPPKGGQGAGRDSSPETFP